MKLRGLRQARQRSGLSLGQLAELTGLRRETIAHLEHGKGEPQPYVVNRLALALDTSPASLIGTATGAALEVREQPARREPLGLPAIG
jgi:transcriptional regulator with XRE-family HTH domain